MLQPGQPDGNTVHRSLMWVLSSNTEPPFAAFPMPVGESWNEKEQLGIQTSAHIRSQHLKQCLYPLCHLSYFCHLIFFWQCVKK